MKIRLITSGFDLNSQIFREHDIVAVKYHGATTDMALESALYEMELEGKSFSIQELETIKGQPYFLFRREK